jgi:hypothetical protein
MSEELRKEAESYLRERIKQWEKDVTQSTPDPRDPIDAYEAGYKARAELDRWRKYPEERPEQDLYYFVIIPDDKGYQWGEVRFWDGEGFTDNICKDEYDNVSHWKPIVRPDKQ